MTTTSADIASKPSRSSSSLLRHNDNEMTTTSSDSRTKPAEPTASCPHNNDGKITPTLNDIAAKLDKTSSSTPCRGDTAVTTMFAVPRTTPVTNPGKNNTDSARDSEREAKNVDVGRLDTKSPAVTVVAVDGENQSARHRMDISRLREDRANKSPSLCNQHLKVANCSPADYITLKSKGVIQKLRHTL